MVSVIVLTYNHERYIAKALSSILNQKTSFSYEIVIGDDNSTDRTLDVVREFQTNNPGIIRIVEHETNVGASRNSYDTMRSAKGKYLASCEGDDYWTDPDKLQLQIDFLEANTDYVGCFHNITCVDENDRPLRKHISWVTTKKVFSLKDFKGVKLPGHIVSIVRKNYFLDEQYDPRIIYEADKHIADRTNVLLLLAKGDFYRIEGEMACYRSAVHGNNLTNQLFKNNPERITRDYRYTLILEEYANNQLHVDAGFKYHKRELFVKNVVLHVIDPQKYDLSVATDILKRADNPLWYYCGFIPVLFQLIFRNVFNI